MKRFPALSSALILSFYLLLGSCEKEKPEPTKLLYPNLLPDLALVDFSESELYSDTATSFMIKINYLPGQEISVPQTNGGLLKYELSYSLTGEEEGEVEMDHEILNDSIVAINIKKPLLANKDYLLQVFAYWYKKTETNGVWKECGNYYKQEITQKIITSLHPDFLDPYLLSKTALIDFSEKDFSCNIANSFTLRVNYLPQDEIFVPRTGEGYLRYDLTYSLTGEEGEVEMGHEIVNDTTILLNSKKPLLSNKNYTLHVFASWQKKTGINEVWQDCDDVSTEEISQNIITNLPLNELIIVESDFIFQYPLDRQFNYLKEEYPLGYFRLNGEKRNQLMLDNYIIRILNVQTGMDNITELVYNESLDVFEYALQANFLENESVYEISLLTENEEDVYTYYFKTSKYNSFSEKWDMLKTCFAKTSSLSLYLSDDPYADASSRVHKTNVNLPDETLDYYENNVNRFSGSVLPLIQFETHIPEEWKTTVEWQIYSWNSLNYERRNNIYKKYGFPPLRSIYYFGDYRWAVKLSDASLTGSIEYPEMPGRLNLVWEVPNWMKYDALSATKFAREIREERRDEFQKIAAENYPDMDRLSFDYFLNDDVFPLVNVYYVLPGLNIETTCIPDFQLQ